MGGTSFVKRHALPLYFVLAYAIAWGGILMAVGPGNIPGAGEQIERGFMWVFLAMLAGPSIAGVVMTALADGRVGLHDLAARLRRWRVPLRWYGAALLTAPLLLAVIMTALSLFSPAFRPGILTVSDKAGLIGMSLAGGLLAGFFEEIGWTGFATPRMQRRFGVLTGGLILGAVWMLWHGLADLWGSVEVYGAWYALHFLLWLAALTAYRVLMGWVYSRTASLLVGQLMHASFTGSQFLLSPAAASTAQNILWYAFFAAGLWLLVAIMARRMKEERIA